MARKGAAAILPAAVVMALGAGVPSAPAFGQEVPSTSGDSSSVSSAELKAFAATQAKVNAVVEKWRPRIDAAQSAERAHSLNQEASQEVLETIESGDLPPKRYNVIYGLMHRDPEIADRVQAHLRELGE